VIEIQASIVYKIKTYNEINFGCSRIKT